MERLPPAAAERVGSSLAALKLRYLPILLSNTFRLHRRCYRARNRLPLDQ
jgi:hypothetical protein